MMREESCSHKNGLEWPVDGSRLSKKEEREEIAALDEEKRFLEEPSRNPGVFDVSPTDTQHPQVISEARKVRGSFNAVYSHN